MSLENLRKEGASICIIAVAIIVTAVSLFVDITFHNEVFWFQRSGAVMTVAGVWFQYRKIVSTWTQAFESEINYIPTKESSESGQGIKMSDIAKESWQTRDFVKRIHDIVTAKSPKDLISIFLVVSGTLIWAYGDLPFRC